MVLPPSKRARTGGCMNRASIRAASQSSFRNTLLIAEQRANERKMIELERRTGLATPGRWNKRSWPGREHSSSATSNGHKSEDWNSISSYPAGLQPPALRRKSTDPYLKPHKFAIQ
mmetsp:Transcript_26998/g.37567  ORF Transcript_26998/g.37567 Transcript_26998/m.37567 type:complete len:116 (-) Transcript_26998:198-545(-)